MLSINNLSGFTCNNSDKVEMGHDTFDSYPIAYGFGILESNTGFLNGWQIIKPYVGIIGIDSFDAYTNTDDFNLTEEDPGFINAWTIVENFIKVYHDPVDYNEITDSDWVVTNNFYNPLIDDFEQYETENDIFTMNDPTIWDGPFVNTPIGT